MLPEIARAARSAAGEAEQAQVGVVAEDGLVARGDRVAQDAGERRHRPLALLCLTGVALLDQRAHRGDRRPRDGEVGGRALLHVEHADLDRAAVEARDAAARVDPLVAQHALGIERREVAVDPAEQDVLVLAPA